jgi:dTDP-glucose 4,6-dehydratase
LGARILLTGIGGFVGHHAAEHFLKNTNWEIVGIDSWKHKGDSLRLRHLIADSKWRNRLQIFTHDLVSPISDRLIDSFGKIDFVLNIASESHVDRSITDPVPFVQNNVALILNVAEYVRKIKPKMFIQCSTDEVFGPALEHYEHMEDELHAPSNPYAASKAAQEDILFSYWRCYGIPYVRTNCMNMIGERQDVEKFIPLCISKINRGEVVDIHGSEETVGSRMYLHARNLADAWKFILERTEPTFYRDHLESTRLRVQKPDAYNIVGEKEISNLEMAELIADTIGKRLCFAFVDFHAARPGHDRRYALDGEKLKNLGWVPPVNLEDSLQKTVLWTLKSENRIWLK